MDGFLKPRQCRDNCAGLQCDGTWFISGTKFLVLVPALIFVTKFFRYWFWYFFPVPIQILFSGAGSGTFLGTDSSTLFRYQFLYLLRKTENSRDQNVTHWGTTRLTERLHVWRQSGDTGCTEECNGKKEKWKIMQWEIKHHGMRQTFGCHSSGIFEFLLPDYNESRPLHIFGNQ